MLASNTTNDQEFTAAVEAFKVAARRLSDAWTLTGVHGYPAYLPSFDDFVCDLADMRVATVEASVDRAQAARVLDLLAEFKADNDDVAANGFDDTNREQFLASFPGEEAAMDRYERNRRALARAEDARLDPPDDPPECPECDSALSITTSGRRNRPDEAHCTNPDCDWTWERDVEGEHQARMEAREADMMDRGVW